MGRRKKKHLSVIEQEEREERNWFNGLGRRAYIFELLSRAKGQEVCTDEEYTYYSVIVEGRSLMYRRRTQRTDGRKMYQLSDQLAMLMGFDSFRSFVYLCRSIQVWRGWTSPERLRAAVSKYIESVRKYYD